MTERDIWDHERSFWLDGPDFYRKHMASNALMVFPEPAGILVGEAILRGLELAPRWNTVEIAEKSEERVGDTLVLTYRATGRRSGAEPYRALCSSTYALLDGEWKLASHQQTPVG